MLSVLRVLLGGAPPALTLPPAPLVASEVVLVPAPPVPLEPLEVPAPPVLPEALEVPAPPVPELASPVALVAFAVELLLLLELWDELPGASEFDEDSPQA